MTHHKCQTAVMVLMIATASLRAQAIPGRWEKVERLQPGTQVVVTLKTRDRLECAFYSVSPDAIHLSELSGKEQTFPKSAVNTIEGAAKERDRLCNGALIGAAIGAVAGMASFYAFARSKTASGPVIYEEGVGVLVASGLVGGAGGAAMGAIVDAQIRGHEVLYQAR